MLLPRDGQAVQALVDEPVVVETRDLVVAPEVEPEQVVEAQRGLFPLFVRLGVP